MQIQSNFIDCHAIPKGTLCSLGQASKGDTVWQLFTCSAAVYGPMLPHRIAERVAFTGMRPRFPPIAPLMHAKYVQLAEACWHADPTQRPSAPNLVHALDLLRCEAEEEQQRRAMQDENRGGSGGSDGSGSGGDG